MITNANEWENYFKSFPLPNLSKNEFANSLQSNIANKDKLTYFIFDFSTLHNCYLSDNFENITGHSKESGKKGFEFMQENIHPEDLMRTMIFSQKSHEFLLQLPIEERKGAKLRMNYRLSHPTKEWSMILHQATFEKFTDEGLPSIAVGFLYEMNDLLNIDFKIGVLELLKGQIISLDEESQKLQLTSREKEIILLAKDGLASKNIADILHISVNTVNNTRAKILKKTGSKNIAEIVARAVKEGII